MIRPASLSGRTFIKRWEKFAPNRYRDVAGHWTIGYGHKIKPGETFVQPLTFAQAETLFAKDVTVIAEEPLTKALGHAVVDRLPQPVWDMLVSLGYNVGVSDALTKSTLLDLVRAGDLRAAADRLPKWNKVRNPQTRELEVCDGLTNRRNEEREIWLKGLANGQT